MKCNTRQLVFLLFAAVLLVFAHGAALPKREIEDAIDDVLRGGVHEKNGQSHDENMDTSNAQLTDRYCHSSNPCGWALYNQYTRQIEYYMKGACSCPDGKTCLRAEEDVSVAAYVYRCR